MDTFQFFWLLVLKRNEFYWNLLIWHSLLLVTIIKTSDWSSIYILPNNNRKNILPLLLLILFGFLNNTTSISTSLFLKPPFSCRVDVGIRDAPSINQVSYLSRIPPSYSLVFLPLVSTQRPMFVPTKPTLLLVKQAPLQETKEHSKIDQIEASSFWQLEFCNKS